MDGTDVLHRFPRLNAEALTTGWGEAPALWQVLTNPERGARSESGVARVWLDVLVRAGLDTSVPRTGTRPRGRRGTTAAVCRSPCWTAASTPPPGPGGAGGRRRKLLRCRGRQAPLRPRHARRLDRGRHRCRLSGADGTFTLAEALSCGPPATCWGARTMVESTETAQYRSSSASAWAISHVNTRSRVPPMAHIRSRP
ncbi:hypothetical protein GCM10010400_10980 [Streptomyces aculeolatus]